MGRIFYSITPFLTFPLRGKELYLPFPSRQGEKDKRDSHLFYKGDCQ